MGLESTWADPAEDEVQSTWVRGVYDALRPHFASGNYVNAAEATDETRAVYGDAKYERLVALKREWDLENVFRLNANIAP